jgi:hypothetical protein
MLSVLFTESCHATTRYHCPVVTLSLLETDPETVPFPTLRTNFEPVGLKYRTKSRVLLLASPLLARIIIFAVLFKYTLAESVKSISPVLMAG